ncbi:nuclear transport factor 2 family protein [Pseudonocardia nematodicida]|uniref:Nuclear transport factor 2 family protein n=1 Tax=Pseudonocardia nematodicida TaxID=1206997 RepID=A0ABV1K4X4_9PSEU
MTSPAEDRIARLEARLEIEELVSRYALAADDRDLGALVACYTRDGVFDSLGGPVRGHDALRRTYRQRFAAFGPTLHTPHRVVLDELGPEDAAGRVSGHSEIVTEDGLFVVAHRYTDRYRREDGAWRFAARVSRIVYAMPLAELLTVTPGEPRARWPRLAPADADLPESLPSWVEFHRAPPEG